MDNSRHLHAPAVAALTWGQARGPLVLAQGLALVWQPAAILGLQALGIGSFLLLGASTVTGSHLRFFVHQDHGCGRAHDEDDEGEDDPDGTAPVSRLRKAA
jgi:hypothetical protein